MAAEAVFGLEDLHEIRLFGHLGKRFGRVHKVSVRTCREATQALAAILEGFAQHVVKHGLYYVFAGDRKTVANNRDETLLDAPLGRGETVFIVPVVQGAKKGGVLQTVVGAVLVVVGAYFGQGWLVQIGVSLIAGGVTQMLTRPSQKKASQAPDNLPSYHFDGPLNSTREGVAVPVVFGEVITGSAVVSQGIRSSELAI